MNTDLRKAAEMALEALETLMLEKNSIYDRAIQALRQALAQPEQEPVAWRNTETGEFCTGGFLRKDLAKWTPLYTAPPKREWVELSDDELEDLEFASVDMEYGHLDIRELSRAIQAKFKEKNT